MTSKQTHNKVITKCKVYEGNNHENWGAKIQDNGRQRDCPSGTSLLLILPLVFIILLVLGIQAASFYFPKVLKYLQL